jgi:hypothetical protein
MSQKSRLGQEFRLGLHHKVGKQLDALRSGSHSFSPDPGSRHTGADPVKLPLGGSQALGRAGGELRSGFGLLLQQSQDILEDLPV